MDLRSYREKHGLTASEMGRRLGVAHTTIARMESRELIPTGALLIRIAEATEGKVTPNDVLLGVAPQAKDAAA